MENTSKLTDLTIVDGIKLEIGKIYLTKYIHCKSEWFETKITRLTNMGHCWGENKNSSGIITNSYYFIKELINKENDDPIIFAKNWLNKNGFKKFSIHNELPKIFSNMIIEYNLKNNLKNNLKWDK